MTQGENNPMVNNYKTKLQQVISIPVSLFKSMRGKYFVGQTGTLLVGNESDTWAGLINPRNSNVNLYVNVFTISNFSDNYLTAEIWLNTNLPEKGNISHKISPTNTTLNPLPKNRVQIGFVESTTQVPEKGVNVYERIVPPHTTLVGEEDGKFIESPAGNYVIVLKSTSSKLNKVIVAFGWWEKSIC